MSPKTRVAFAAGLIALFVFTVGAVWFRLEIGEMNVGYEKARAAGEQVMGDAITAAAVQGKTFPIEHTEGPTTGLRQFSISEIDWLLWPGVILAAALVGFVAWAAASGALRPVELMRWQAAEVTAGSLNRRIDVPVRGLGIDRISIGLRAALAAGLIASGPLIGGVVWLRHAVDEVYNERLSAEIDAAGRAHDAIAATLEIGLPIPAATKDSDAFHYEVVHSDGRTEYSSFLAAAVGQLAGEPILPRPDPGATADWYSYRTIGVDEVTTAKLQGVIPGFNEWTTNIWTRTVRTGPGTSAAVYVFERRTVEDNPAAAMDKVLVPGVPAALVLIGFVAWFATGRALLPVERIREQAEEISAKALDVRVPVPPTRDAISRLANTLNEMLDRLENSVKVQRQFIADAAHELRSPIASLRTVLEVAHDHPDQADWPSVVRDAVTDTRRLEALAEDLLLLARLDSALPLPTARIDLSEVVSGCSDRADVAVDGPAFVIGDPKQLDRLLRNLVDNAVRHAVSKVTVSVQATDDRVILAVADDGPGIPVADRERVFDRFARLDEARDSDAGGAGLGLAIAREIAVRHGGTLTVGDHAVFTASFPKASSS